MEFIFLVALIVLNGFFAMSEIALVAAKPSRLKTLAETKRAAQVALNLKENPTRFLSTIQIGITIIGLLSGIVGEATLSKPFEHWLVGHGIEQQSANILSTAVVVVCITYFAIVVGELVPKRFAQSNAERIAVLAAYPIHWVSTFTRPFVSLLAFSTKSLLGLLGQRDENIESVTEEDITALVDEGSETGAIEPREQTMIRNILHLNDRPVSSLMTPRRDIDYIDIDQPIDTLVRRLRQTKHSVFPVCRGNLDNVIGTISSKALVNQLDNLSIPTVANLLKQPVYIHESMKGLQLINHLQAIGAEMAFIVDEYGDIQGLVTYYDILEAIAGELSLAPDDIWAEELEPQHWLMDASIPIAELKQRLDLNQLEGEAEAGYQTLNGLLLWKFETLPDVGDEVMINHWRFTITEVKDHRILSVDVHYQALPDTDISH
ncbi:HlyC/CorC family transporter [Vibrio sp. SM6]|uniref:HlyC/CorC family transporter n=1 Tax=Vibrio agarilyticus TaxID=2726741 RepID=A0A7X8YIH9_9VIBR|nr:hemolysin family protein [Vibrio agarilyticus]NLS14407.1 HlyC/CorC family transporter [Vibrio agarilyticus]